MIGRGQGIIFDLDDTLLDTSDVYWRARSQFVSILAREKVPEQDALDIFEATDTEMMQLHGVIPERYGISMRLGYQKLATKHQFTLRPESIADLERAGELVSKTIPTLIDGAIQLLNWTCKRFRLALLTRGSESLQIKKIRENGLDRYFDSIRVVARKDANEFLRSAKELSIEPSDCWAIGASIKSDVNPALTAGMKAVLFVYTHHSYHWQQEYGSVPIAPYYKVEKLEQIPDLLDKADDLLLQSHLVSLQRPDHGSRS